MKLSKAILGIHSLLAIESLTYAQDKEGTMTKMCLFYPTESGHARSDPILNQKCPSDHVHTFYGPQNFHPNTSYNDLRNTKAEYSSSPYTENQSLYWHPSIYRVTETNGQKNYELVKGLESSPYYRWDVDAKPATVAFPPDFRMIAYSNQKGADSGGETGMNLLVECCDYTKNGEENCKSTTGGTKIIFPKTTCDFLGVAMSMPTCWDTSKGVGTEDPFSHVAYTVDGTVSGDCPDGYDARIPQVQLFVRINKYKGGTYQLSDESPYWHVDFMNGWKEGKLAEIIKKCKKSGEPGFNPPCDCEQFLTEVGKPAKAVCASDVKKFILNEDIERVSTLPRGTCKLTDLIPRGSDWATSDPPFTCKSDGGGDNDDGDGDDDGGDGDDDGGDEGCEDSELEFKDGKKLKDCSMTGKNLKKFCKRAKSHCPETCESEKFCEMDSFKKFKVEGQKKLKNCKWVKKAANSRCGIGGVCETCRSTCADYESCSEVA